MTPTLQLASSVEAALDFMVDRCNKELSPGFIFLREEDADKMRDILSQMRRLSNEILDNRGADDVGPTLP